MARSGALRRRRGAEPELRRRERALAPVRGAGESPTVELDRIVAELEVS